MWRQDQVLGERVAVDEVKGANSSSLGLGEWTVSSCRFVEHLVSRRAESEAEHGDKSTVVEKLAADIRRAAEYTCGRRRVKEAFSAFCATRVRFRIRETCNEIERAVEDSDSGKMCHGLRQLGVRHSGQRLDE